MAKYYNNIKKTGRLAGSVFAIRSGVTIERAYNPVVANPSTSKQVSARARFKLISQLSAVIAPYVAIRPEGIVSSRNLFVKKNYGKLTYSGNAANIILRDLTLTASAIGLPAVQAARTANALNAELTEGLSTGDVSHIVYVVLSRGADGALRVVGSAVVTAPGANNTYEVSIPISVATELTVLAYGVRENTEKARVLFSEMDVISATMIAEVIANRQITSEDVTLTETRGVNVAALS